EEPGFTNPELIYKSGSGLQIRIESQPLGHLFVDTVRGEFSGDEQGIVDGSSIGGSVTDDADPVDSQKRGSARFVVGELLSDFLAGFGGGLAFGLETADDVPGNRAEQHVGDSLGDFEDDVADETFADQDIRFALINPPSL